MPASQWVPLVLATGAIVAVLSTYPYVATAISYRRSDNGLAYILLVMGVGVWNAMFAAQLIDPRPLVKGFFFALSMVGASLAALGWFLFASTASSTRRVPKRRLVYGAAAVLVGVNIAFVTTTPAHELYWTVAAETASATGFVEIDPRLGYWLHTQLLVVLFAAGTILFAVAWKDGISVPYTRAYTIAGTVTVVAVLASNALFPGGTAVAPIAAAGLTTVGWVQADSGRLFMRLRPLLRST